MSQDIEQDSKRIGFDPDTGTQQLISIFSSNIY